MWKFFRWTLTAALLGSIAWSARELVTVTRFARGIPGPNPIDHDALVRAMLPPQALATLAAGLEKSAAINRSTPTTSTSAFSAVRQPSRRAEMNDTNSAPGRIIHTRLGAARPPIAGGGVIVGEDGSRIEIVPAKRRENAP